MSRIISRPSIRPLIRTGSITLSQWVAEKGDFHLDFPPAFVSLITPYGTANHRNHPLKNSPPMLTLRRRLICLISLLALLFAGFEGCTLRPPRRCPRSNRSTLLATWRVVRNRPPAEQFSVHVCGRHSGQLSPGRRGGPCAESLPQGGWRNRRSQRDCESGRREPQREARVSFFRPFYGDYWILALDPHYRWFSSRT